MRLTRFPNGLDSLASTALAVLVLVFTAIPGSAAAQDGTSKLVGAPIQAAIEGVRLKNLDGETVELSSYIGDGPVILDFWATWCKPCLAAMPELNKLHKELEPRGLRVVGINEDGPRNASKVKPFVRTKGYDFTILLDLNRVAQQRLNALALPTTLVVDADGKVVHTSFGYRPGEIDKLREVIEPLLTRVEDE